MSEGWQAGADTAKQPAKPEPGGDGVDWVPLSTDDGVLVVTPPRAKPAMSAKTPAPAVGPPAPDAQAPAEPAEASPPAGTTEITRSPEPVDAATRSAEVRFVALLTDNGQQISQGLVWRIYRAKTPADSKERLVGAHVDAAPVVKLKPGDYMVNAAFGRANMTRKIVVKPAQPSSTERFVLNAGGLRLAASANGAPATSTVIYSIYADERDQFDNRVLVLGGAKPGLVHRLNAGLYQIVSRHGDANAIVQADVQVEAGKLTEVAVAHIDAAITFKLVNRAGGEALPGTQWLIQTTKGETVKESVGALPTHILAPGDYAVTAKSGGRAFKLAFRVTGGQPAQVEVVMR